MSNDLQCKIASQNPQCSTDQNRYFPDGISIKQDPHGADILNLDYRLQATYPDVMDVWKRYGYGGPVITSGNDGVHSSPRSLHYQNLAIDIRGRDIPADDLRKMASELQQRLGGQYFVQAEIFPDPNRNHIHIQWRN